MKQILIAFAALAAFGAAEVSLAQSTNAKDDMELLVSQIQADKRAVVLSAMQLTDAEVAAFTPVYDKYQADMKKQFESAVEMLNKFAANYGSMTDDAAKKMLKEWFALVDDENDLVQSTAKRMGKVLPPTKVVRFVQIENKLNTVMRLPAVRAIPLAE